MVVGGVFIHSVSGSGWRIRGKSAAVGGSVVVGGRNHEVVNYERYFKADVSCDAEPYRRYK